MDKQKGLSEKEAKERLKQFGYNEIQEVKKVSVLGILFRQVRSNFVIYLLLGAAILSILVGKSVTAYTVFMVIVLVVGAGFFQEYKAEKAVAALKNMIMPVSIVLRDGKETEVISKEIVPDDILILRTGERIPADCVVIEAKELMVNEAVLTGESREVPKVVASGDKYEKTNLIFAGTYIVNGRCLAKVLHTGMKTEFGKIAGLISSAEKELPLQKKINVIAKFMVVVAITCAILAGGILLLRSESINQEVFLDVLIVSIALAVAAFPEGFPVVLVSTLASGSYRMAQKNAIVNRMSIIETLGETTVICSDKTGTITKGEMTVKKVLCSNSEYEVSGSGYKAEGDFILRGNKIDSARNKVLDLMLRAGVLCNDSRIERKGTDEEFYAHGTPTESALLILAAKAKIFKEDLSTVREEEIPFSSERKLMSVLCKEGREFTIYAKGAPEYVLKNCKFIQKENGIFKLTESEKKRIMELNGKMTSSALRTLAIAYKKSNSKDKSSMEKDLIFLGIVGMEDPPRDDVKAALKLCYNAGIDVKMITGDHKDTAVAIAKEIGLRDGKVLEGVQIEEYTDEYLARIVRETVVFARVKPEHKLRIVRALKANGEVVTMTGDGVNDAPALKEAHIGVAMGIGGTDVTREVADLTLRDDNFATIASAVKEGRTIFSNIQKFATYQLSCTSAELFVILLGIILGLPIPLLALQILFMNLVTDNLPAITLGFNPSSHDVMEMKPRRKSTILTKRLAGLIVLAASIMGLVTLGVYYFVLRVLEQDVTIARSTALVTLVFFELANAFNFRSFRKGVFGRSLFVNKYLMYASLISIVALLLVIYSPLNVLFETAPVPLLDFGLAIVGSLIIVVVFDLLKLFKGDLSK